MANQDVTELNELATPADGDLIHVIDVSETENKKLQRSNLGLSKYDIGSAGDLLYGTGLGALSNLGIGTSGQVLAVDGGATGLLWKTLSGGSFNTGDIHEVELERETLVAQGEFDFTSISQDYDHLMIYAAVRQTQTAVASTFAVQLNGDATDTNYRRAYKNFGNSSSAGTLHNTDVIVAAANCTANYFSLAEILSRNCLDRMSLSSLRQYSNKFDCLRVSAASIIVFSRLSVYSFVPVKDFIFSVAF